MKRKDILITHHNQVELAYLLGVSQPMVSKWMSGKVIPRPETMVRICKVLDIPVDEFIDFIYAKNKRLAELSQVKKRRYGQ